MPLRHHGGTPHTKRQQRTKTGKDTAVVAHAAGIERDIHTEPFNHGRWEQAVHTHTAGHAPAPTTGGTMSATEDAAAIRAAGHTTYEQILGAVNAVQEDISKVMATLQLVNQASEEGVAIARQHLGEGHENLNDILGAVAQLGTAVGDAQGMLAAVDNERNTLQARAAQVSETFAAAANRIGGGN